MSGIDSDLIRGHIDTIILKSLYHGDKYGLEIIQEVEEKSKGTYELKQPTLYSCLKRLESQGLISSYWQDSEIGGKRHYYKLTEKGLETYKANQEDWLRSREIIDNLIYNTSVKYADIYDDDLENQKKDQATDQEQENEQINAQEFLTSDNEETTDEFASFDDVKDTASENFFASNNDEFEEEPAISYEVAQEPEQDEQDNDVVNMNFDEQQEEPEQEVELGDDNEIYMSEDDKQDDENDDEQIYEPNVEEEQDEQENKQDEQESQEQEDLFSPTYVNFADNNYDEVDITKPIEQEEVLEEETEEPQDNSIQDTASQINEQYYAQSLPQANKEDIDNMYRTTDNYQNLQAGYTDETYKQILSELENYGDATVHEEPANQPKKAILSFGQLQEQFDKEGISIKKHERQLKETDDSKLYVKSNELKMINSWITWGTISVALLAVFAIMSLCRTYLAFPFAFWQFAVAAAACLVIPAYYTIRYYINPYKKSLAKYAPRLNILINLLVSVQLVIIVYCVNLQLGFYSFSQINYNHLLWIIPLVLCFIPIIHAFVYTLLYNSKRYHT